MEEKDFFVTAAAGTADLLAAELAALGATGLRELRAGVGCTGTLELAYRACLWSRVGLHVLWPAGEFRAVDADGLYAGIRGIDWSQHLGPDDTLAVDVTTQSSPLTHSRYAAQKVKDAVVDQLRERFGTRPSGRPRVLQPGPEAWGRVPHRRARHRHPRRGRPRPRRPHG